MTLSWNRAESNACAQRRTTLLRGGKAIALPSDAFNAKSAGRKMDMAILHLDVIAGRLPVQGKVALGS